VRNRGWGVAACRLYPGAGWPVVKTEPRSTGAARRPEETQRDHRNVCCGGLFYFPEVSIV